MTNPDFEKRASEEAEKYAEERHQDADYDYFKYDGVRDFIAGALWGHAQGAKDERELKDRCERYRGALESIASRMKPRHGEYAYWLSIDHTTCARVLRADTCTAREALKEPEEGVRE